MYVVIELIIIKLCTMRYLYDEILYFLYINVGLVGYQNEDLN